MMPATTEAPSPPISLWDRLLAHWPLKLLLLTGLSTSFSGSYVYLSHHAFFPVHQLPWLGPDWWSGFDPRWVWIYQSLYLLTTVLPALATEKEQLRKYVAGFALVVGCSFFIFFFFPTQAPRPDLATVRATFGRIGGPWSGSMYDLLMSYDGPYNACPSLHGGFLYYKLAFARRVYQPPRWLAMGMIGWAMLILWATLATKEHYFVDLVAGIALAVVCDAIVWRKKPQD